MPFVADLSRLADIKIQRRSSNVLNHEIKAPWLVLKIKKFKGAAQKHSASNDASPSPVRILASIIRIGDPAADKKKLSLETIRT